MRWTLVDGVWVVTWQTQEPKDGQPLLDAEIESWVKGEGDISRLIVLLLSRNDE
jgi:hypothetical protein